MAFTLKAVAEPDVPASRILDAKSSFSPTGVCPSRAASTSIRGVPTLLRGSLRVGPLVLSRSRICSTLADGSLCFRIAQLRLHEAQPSMSR